MITIIMKKLDITKRIPPRKNKTEKLKNSKTTEVK
jgi:hypothetical protein